jgi:hypothetical protein
MHGKFNSKKKTKLHIKKFVNFSNENMWYVKKKKIVGFFNLNYTIDFSSNCRNYGLLKKKTKKND